MSPSARATTGCILAGGRGHRLGGIDKGLFELAGRPLVVHVLEALRPQVDDIVISANRNEDRYRAIWNRVVADANSDYDGPLAGFEAGMTAAGTPLLATVPCDSPFPPSDLVVRLAAALERERADIAVARVDGRLQPVFALLRTSLLGALRETLGHGERKIARWYGTQNAVEVDFSDAADAFANINTPADAEAMEARLAGP